MPLRLLPLDQHLAEGQRSVCALFADIVGSTRLAHSLEVSHYANLMTETVQLMILSTEAQGGEVLQHQGDAVLCLWPSDQAAQALQAGLTLHSRLLRLELARLLGVRLELRVGLAVGRVIMGDVGGLPNAYGLPLNLARRLCTVARPGETLLCPQTAQHLDPSSLRLRPLEPMAGFEELCEAYTALPEHPGGIQMKIG